MDKLKKLIFLVFILGSVFMFSDLVNASELGVKDGKLSQCPDSPNCVSSQATDEAHKIAPLVFESSPTQAMANLKTLINSMKRTKIIKEKDNYLHAEFRTFLGFVDDVEFYVDEKNKLIHIRSASRVGHSDFGVNRKRAERIRKEFNKLTLIF